MIHHLGTQARYAAQQMVGKDFKLTGTCNVHPWQIDRGDLNLVK